MDGEGRISDLDLCAARDLLRWTQADLAKRAGVGVVTIRRFERGATIGDGRRDALKRALVEAGVLFFGRIEIDGVPVAGGVALRPDARPAPMRQPKPYPERAGRKAADA